MVRRTARSDAPVQQPEINAPAPKPGPVIIDVKLSEKECEAYKQFLIQTGGNKRITVHKEARIELQVEIADD